MTKKIIEENNNSFATTKCGPASGNTTQSLAKSTTQTVMVNPDNKQKLIKALIFIRNQLNRCIKIVSQNRLDSKKLGSQSALSQQLDAVGNKLAKVEALLIKASIIKVPKDKSKGDNVEDL